MSDVKVNLTNNIDTVFEWGAEEDSEPNGCRLRIYWITQETSIVVATDLTDNPGRKIATATKEIIFLVSHNYDVDPNKSMLIEHYSTGTSSDEDTYLHVLLTNNKTIRYEIKRSKLMELIGKPI